MGPSEELRLRSKDSTGGGVVDNRAMEPVRSPKTISGKETQREFEKKKVLKDQLLFRKKRNVQGCVSQDS